MSQGGCDSLTEAVKGQAFQILPINVTTLNLLTLAPSIY